MDKRTVKFILAIAYAIFMLVMAFAYGYNSALLHIFKKTQITQEGDIVRFTCDDHEMIYIIERR